MGQFNRNIVTLLQKNMVLVRVTFELLSNEAMQALAMVKDFRTANRKTYTYKAPNNLKIAIGDKVVVKVGDELKIVTVVKVGEPFDLNADFDYKPIVQKIDTTIYDALMDQEAKVRELILEAETKHQTELALSAYKSVFPEGSEARIAFDRAVEASAKVLEIGNGK